MNPFHTDRILKSLALFEYYNVSTCKNFPSSSRTANTIFM